MSEWISVDDRLPKDGEEVICLFGDRTVTACYITPEYGEHEAHEEVWKIWNTTSGSLVFGVEMWQPLPEPPEE